MVPHSETIDFLKRREGRRQSALDEMFQKAVNDCEKIINYIVTTYKPSRLWQWGSLLDRKRFTEKSDIDIAIEGLSSPSDIFKILARAEETPQPVPVKFANNAQTGHAADDHLEQDAAGSRIEIGLRRCGRGQPR